MVVEMGLPWEGEELEVFVKQESVCFGFVHGESFSPRHSVFIKQGPRRTVKMRFF